MNSKARLICSVLVLVSFISLASAQSSEIVFNQIGEKVLVDQKINFESEKEISISLPSDAHSISSNLNYSLEDKNLIIKGKNIRISYLSQNLLSKIAGGYYLIDKIVFNEDFAKVTIKIAIEEGNSLESEKIFPDNFKTETDGEQIFVIWELNNIKRGDDFPFFISIKTRNSGINTFTWIIPAILIVLFGIYYAYSKLAGKTKKTSNSSEIDKHLVDAEKKILDNLRKSDRGELWQKQLQLSTGFSKAKLSRVIRNLEARNLIEKIPFGNTNKVRLK
ncbi:hypothetical protein J4229_01145 [Candidatus Pacearchaeota archaeon]|nr:hypothetical protein [Candidatus Pacearchaeota archaeon]